MHATDVQQSTLAHALVFYKKHLESRREQQENSLPRNGKSPATADDLSVARAFDEQLQALTNLLVSTEDSPEQIIQQIKRPPTYPPPPVQTVNLTVADEFDTEPYINPFTGQLITPNTPSTAGSSNSHISANIPRRDRAALPTVDHRQGKPAPSQESSAPTTSSKSATKQSLNEPDVGRPRSPYRPVKDSRSFDTTRVVPAARSYASQPAFSDEGPLTKSRWGTISRLKHLGNKTSVKFRGEKRGERLQTYDVGHPSPNGDNPVVPVPSLRGSPTPTTGEVSREARPSPQQPVRAKDLLEPKPNEEQVTLPRQIKGLRRYETMPPLELISTSSNPPAPSIAAREGPRVKSDIFNAPQYDRRPPQAVEHVSPQSFFELQGPAPHPKPSPLPMRHPRVAPTQSTVAAPSHRRVDQPLPADRTNPPEPAASALPWQPPQEWTHQRAAETPERASSVAEATMYDESLKLAFELSGGVPQDYAFLQQIQKEHEISAQLLESQQVAQKLAGQWPQDYAAVNRLQAEHESALEYSRLTDTEWQRGFDADRELARSLAADDAPQQIQELGRVEQQRQLELQREARIAREIATREDAAEAEAQLAMARRLQAELDASEASQIAEQQRLAQEIADREDRLELERLQAEWNVQEPAQTATHSARGAGASLDANTWSSERPPPSPSQPKRGRKVSSPSRRPSSNRPPRPPPPPQQVSTNASSNQDAAELSTLIAERRARHGRWQAEVQKANHAAKEAEGEIRRLEQQQRVLAEKARQEEEARRREEQKKALAEKARRAEEMRQREQQERARAEKARKEEEARRAAIEAERRAKQAECTVCTDRVEKTNMAILSCRHAYCGTCIAQAFQLALKAKKPFQCCRSQVPVEVAARFLPQPHSFVPSYQGLLLELATPNPAYCSSSSCSAFIPPLHIKAGTATCPRCSTRTCTACRGRDHPGVICAGDVDGQKLLNLADSKKWQQCPHCKTLMEKASGCLHMTCRCGTQSCYNCGGIWSRCGGTCPRR